MQRPVWIVDDDAAYRELLGLALEIHCDVDAIRAFEDGPDLLQAFATLADAPAPGLVLLDFHLPCMLAPDVLRALRTRGIDVPVVVLSGAASPAERALCLEEGAVTFVEKPARYEELVQALRELTTSAGSRVLP
jgi:two-component system response regulator FixJ